MTDWKSLFGAAENQSLDYFPPAIVDGNVTVTLPNAVVEEGISEWKYSLVAQFLGKPPSVSYLVQILSKIWKGKGFQSLNQIGTNLYLLQFENSEKRDWILENGPWHIQSIPMIFRKWEPNMERLEFASDSLPIWFHLHRIPLEFFNRKGLSYLASALGKPLYMDRITAARKRLAFAKVCVEVSPDFEIPKSINATLENGRSFSIPVSIPWLPSKCSSCKSFGHSNDTCSKTSVAATSVKTLTWQLKAMQQESIPPQNTLESGLQMKVDSTGENSGSQVTPPSDACLDSIELGNVPSDAPQDVQDAYQLAVIGNSARAGTSTGENSGSQVGPPSPAVPTPLAVTASIELGTLDPKGKAVDSSPNADNQFQLVTYKNSSSGSKSSHHSAKSHSAPRVQFSGSKNSFLAIAESADTDITVWQHLVDNAKSARKVRAASKGVSAAVQAMKSTKARNLAKGVSSHPY